MPPERDTRRLSAILAADVAGYSRLMAAEEAGTLARLKAHRFELIDPAMAKNRGRIFKTTGDGLLAEFASAVDAVDCAVEIQRRMARRNADMALDRRIDFRIGINVGDVIVDGDDLHGDAVNVAARLEGIAEPGGITISRAAQEQVRDKLPYALADLGEIEVKNIPRPVRAFRVRIDGEAGLAKATAAKRMTAWQMPALAASVLVVAIAAGLALWRPWSGPTPPIAQVQAPAQTAPAQTAQAPAPLQQPASIAGPVPAERAALIVLPFANISGDPSQEYFSDGITEDITTALARIPGFLVMARNTAFTFKGKPVNAQAVGLELGVRYLLEGSVQKQADRLRLNAQLIETGTGKHVWAERYDRAATDVFVMQDELADKIVGTVAANLRRREGERALAAPPDKLAAYDLTMRARFLFQSQGRTETFDARRLLQEAIARDPSFAPAYTWLARALNTIWVTPWNEEYANPQTIEAMIVASARGVALAPDDPLARAVNARSLTALQQHDAAAEEALAAFAKGRSDTDVAAVAGSTLLRSGRYQESVDILLWARNFDPYFSPGTVGSTLSSALYQLGRYAESAETARYCVQRSPSQVNCMVNLAAALGQMGQAPDAHAAVREILRASPNLTISAESRRRMTTFRSAADVDHLAEGLRKAGLPE